MVYSSGVRPRKRLAKRCKQLGLGIDKVCIVEERLVTVDSQTRTSHHCRGYRPKASLPASLNHLWTLLPPVPTARWLCPQGAIIEGRDYRDCCLCVAVA